MAAADGAAPQPRFRAKARRGSVDDIPPIDATDEENSFLRSRKSRRTTGGSCSARHSIATTGGRSGTTNAGAANQRRSSHLTSVNPLSGLDDRRSYFEVRKNEGVLQQQNTALNTTLSEAKAALVDKDATLVELKTKLDTQQAAMRKLEADWSARIAATEEAHSTELAKQKLDSESAISCLEDKLAQAHVKLKACEAALVANHIDPLSYTAFERSASSILAADERDAAVKLALGQLEDNLASQKNQLREELVRAKELQNAVDITK